MTPAVIAHWRSAVVGVAGLAAVVIVAMYAPEGQRGEAYTAIMGIVSAITLRHSGQDREKAAP